MCIRDSSQVIDYIEELTPSSQSKRLILIIEEILNNNNLTWENIKFLAVNVGPGSFTGVRIGIAAAKGFSIAIDHLQIISVTSLESCLSQIYDYKDCLLYTSRCV